MIQLRGDPSWPTGPGRTFSVFNWQTMRFDYYWDAAGNPDSGGWDFRPPPAPTPPVSQYGCPIENLLREVPPGARFTGYGPDARGEVAVKDRQRTLWSRQNVPGAGAGLSGAEGPPASLPQWILVGGLIVLGLAFVGKLRQVL